MVVTWIYVITVYVCVCVNVCAYVWMCVRRCVPFCLSFLFFAFKLTLVTSQLCKLQQRHGGFIISTVDRHCISIKMVLSIDVDNELPMPCTYFLFIWKWADRVENVLVFSFACDDTIWLFGGLVSLNPLTKPNSFAGLSHAILIFRIRDRTKRYQKMKEVHAIFIGKYFVKFTIDSHKMNSLDRWEKYITKTQILQESRIISLPLWQKGHMSHNHLW
jgi:hypothetical protein